MPTRPKYAARRDNNDKIVKEALETIQHEVSGFRVVVKDTSKVGEFVDRLVYLGPLCIAIEIKDEMNGEKRLRMMTSGEKNWPGIKFVIHTADELIDCLVKCVPIALSQMLQMFALIEDDEVQEFLAKYLVVNSPLSILFRRGGQELVL